MKYLSTRGSKELKTSAQAIIKGIAEDKGLFVPESIPKMPEKLAEIINGDKKLNSFGNNSFQNQRVLDSIKYKDVALEVLKVFFTDFTEEELSYCVNGAYDEKFEKEEIVPVVKAGHGYFLELYHGKTAAFKDMALSILPYLLTTAMKKEKEDKKICILTATSGDTGKAALAGFADVPGTEIIVYYPEQGVSQVQERQMVTQEGSNTHVFAIDGNFDDAQTAVKKIFSDPKMNKDLEEIGFKFSSANSINIGRLVPQVAYYVFGYIKLLEQGAIKPGEKINVTVPTGNFGNILAAYYAKEMGLPVDKLICASNENKILTDFINTGTYDRRRDFHLTNSPSMDILISSNLERLLYHLASEKANCDWGKNCNHSDAGKEISALMKSLDEEGKYTVSEKIKQGMKDFIGGYVDVNKTNETIGKMYSEHNYLLDTHTAVGYKVYENYGKETGDTKPTLIASTASPYKFAESVALSIGLSEEANGFDYVRAIHNKTGIAIPKGLQDLENKKILHTGKATPKTMPETVINSLK
ncbi:MAG: threonine synthase [Anaerovoracaceae bacterium]